jgi:hypothetical protein
VPKICYQSKRFSGSSQALIDQCNSIIEEYAGQGFVLTLRQLYYQLVSRDLIENKQTEYKRVGSIVNDARLAGLIDWRAIEDRTRNLEELSHWENPAAIVQTCAEQFHVDMWANQKYRPEVWIEKDALVGVIDAVCKELDVPYFSCRGYTSQSEMWVGAMRLRHWLKQDSQKNFTTLHDSLRRQTPVIFHFGDHDPSGKDMTRDIVERLQLFMGGLKVERLALNMDQIEEYKPPPNPAKTTDSRYRAYIMEFGEKSWELDALEPKVIASLIRKSVRRLANKARWKEKEVERSKGREVLSKIAENWEEVTCHLE